MFFPWFVNFSDDHVCIYEKQGDTTAITPIIS